MNVFVRGNIIEFSTQFFDDANAPVDPDIVTLSIVAVSYGGSAVPTILPMVNFDATWMVNWDTTGVASGIVFWAVLTVNPHSADQGNFALTGNLANTT